MGNNTLTPALPKIISDFREVNREATGLTKSVNTDFDTKGAAQDEVITVPIAASGTARNLTVGVVTTEAAAVVVTNVSVTLDNAREVPFHLSGEEELALAQQREGFMNGTMMESMRTLINEIETSLGVSLALGGAYGFGTETVTPFASNLNDTAATEEFQNFSAAPQTLRSVAIDSLAIQNLGELTQLTNVNQAGSSETLRDGVVSRLHGQDIRYSDGLARPVIGTGTGYLIDGALAVGATTLTVDTGSGTIVAGDLITIVGSSFKYIVKTALTGGVTLVIGGKGLRDAIADNAAVTVVAISTRNIAVQRDGAVLAVRPPALPEGGDSARESANITDPVSGLTVNLSKYVDHRQAQWELSAVWGSAIIDDNRVHQILGQ